MEYVVSTFIITVEYLILINISNIFAKPRQKKNLYLYVGIIYVLSGVCIFGNLLKDFSAIKVLAAFVYSAAICMMLYECSIIKVLMVAMVHSGILYAMDYIAFFSVLLVTGKNIQKISDNQMAFIAVAFVSKFGGFITTYCMEKYLVWERSKEKKLYLQWILISIFPLVSVFTIFTLIGLSLQYNIKSIEMIFSITGLMAANIVVLFILNKIEKDQRIEQNNINLQNQIKLQLEKTKALMESYSEQRKQTHDFNNHLQVITDLIKYKQYDNVDKYSKQLLKTAQENKFILQTNNPLMDVLLNQKYSVAKAKDITMQLDFNDLSDMIIAENDLVVILGNAIDNAIEGCTTEKKIIKIKILAGKENNIISVKNTTLSKEKSEDENIATTKKDEINHGYGLKNIKNTAKKYNHDLAIEREEGWFQLTIVIYP